MISKKALIEFFKITPTLSLIVLPDAPKFTIIEVNNAYLKATNSKNEELIGKGIFEACPDNESDPMVDGVKNLTLSLNTVIKTKNSHKMAILKYDIPIRGTSKFDVKYWEVENIPLLGEDGKLELIVHTLVDVTENVLTNNELAFENEEKKNRASELIVANKELAFQNEEKGKRASELVIANKEKKKKTEELKTANEKALYEKNRSDEVVAAHKALNAYKIALDKSSIVAITDQKGIIKYVNDNFCKISKYTSKELIGQDHRIISSGYHAKSFIRNLWITIVNGNIWKGELKNKAKDGTIYWVDTTIVPFLNEKGIPYQYVAIRFDITDRKKAEEEAKKSQQELQKIMDLSLDIICTTDDQGRFLKVSAASTKTWGYTPEELIGKRYMDFVYQDDHQKTNEVESKIYSVIEITDFENTYVHKDGTLVPMIWSARWQEVDKTMYRVAKDNTSIKKAENEVREKQDFIETALENLPIGIAINKIDDDKAIWMNKKFTEIYDWPEEVLKDIPTFFQKVYPDASDRKEIISRVMEDIISDNNDFMNWDDITITTQKGEQKTINTKIIPLFNQNLTISTVVDVTERIKARKAIDESNERFEYVIKATFDAIWDWDLTSDTIYWGEGFERIFGHKIVALSEDSSSWKDCIHPDDAPRVLEKIYAAFEGTACNWKDEYRYKKGNGDYSFVINKGIIIRDCKKRASRMIGAMQDITKHKQEERRLKLLESVITNTTDAVLITEAEPFDRPGPKILFVNEAFTKMTGYTAEEVIGKTPRILQGAKTDIEELKKLGAAIRRWESCEATVLNYKKNGEEFWINMVISPVADETGWFTHWIAIERDVTQQKKEEERLKLLEAVITNTNDGVVIKEANPSSELGRKIVYVNESYTLMTGYAENEIIGKTSRLLQGPLSNQKELERFYKDLDEQVPTEITTINYKKNGEEFWVNMTENPVFNSKGEHTHWVSIERDVTERIKQEQKLFEINQKLFDTLESIQDGFYTLDANWNISYWNHEAERISGKSQNEVVGMNIWDMYEGQISKEIYSKFHKAKEQNKAIRLEVYSKMQNKWFELNAFPSSIGLTVYFKDITERKQIESKFKKMNRALEVHVRELAISNQELEQFAYVASHDLQEPLRMITGFLTQIEKKYDHLLDEKGKKYIFFAVDGANRMRQIILDLLEFCRIGKNEKKLEEINLNDIVDEIVLLYGKQIKEKNAGINYENLPIIRTYSAPIKQIFQNLISNSLKYAKQNQSPVITITSKQNALEWKFKIQDNGIGIDAEYFDKIFIIFQRLHNKDEYSGTGIGLAISKKIVENLGGRIWLKSKENIGTTFYFTIPKKYNKKS